MSDLYLRRKNPQPLHATLPKYYPRKRRRVMPHGYYSELLKRDIGEPIRLELHPNIPASYEIVVADLESTQRHLKSMSARLAKLESRVPEQIEVRDLPLKEAKKLVKNFLKKYLEENRRVYPSDVADALCLEYERVCEVFNVLEEEGKLRKE
ncbi:MAG: hypothetical protein WCD81_06870 [Candidatus Bathyarchaeia archaeon]